MIFSCSIKGSLRTFFSNVQDFSVRPPFFNFLVYFVTATPEARNKDVLCGHFAVQEERLSFVSPQQSSIDVHNTASSPRPNLWWCIFPSFSLSEQLVLIHICPHCVEGHIWNFALCVYKYAPVIWKIFIKIPFFQESSNFVTNTRFPSWETKDNRLFSLIW